MKHRIKYALKAFGLGSACGAILMLFSCWLLDMPIDATLIGALTLPVGMMCFLMACIVYREPEEIPREHVKELYRLLSVLDIPTERDKE